MTPDKDKKTGANLKRLIEEQTSLWENRLSEEIVSASDRKNIVVNNIPNYLSYQGNLNYKLGEKHSLTLSADITT